VMLFQFFESRFFTHPRERENLSRSFSLLSLSPMPEIMNVEITNDFKLSIIHIMSVKQGF